ncbi:MAG TPA: hypothetical protein VLV54_00095 [Thermoanaerobaculia bacterium]|nr:hypothetical protein [Thermoanaerobaculia bacterium]
MVRPSAVQARTAKTLDFLEISAFDAESGVVAGSLIVTCNRKLGSFRAGTNLAAGKSIDPQGSVLRLLLPRRVNLTEKPIFTVSVRDAAGHTTQVVRSFAPPPR